MVLLANLTIITHKKDLPHTQGKIHRHFNEVHFLFTQNGSYMGLIMSEVLYQATKKIIFARRSRAQMIIWPARRSRAKAKYIANERTEFGSVGKVFFGV